MDDLPIRTNGTSFEQLLQQQLARSRPSTATKANTALPHQSLLAELTDSSVDETSLQEFEQLEAQLHAELNDSQQPPPSGNIFSQIVSEYESTFDDGDDVQQAGYSDAHDSGEYADEVPNLSTIIEEDQVDTTEHTVHHDDMYDSAQHADSSDAVIVPSNLVQKYFMNAGNDSKRNTGDSKRTHSRNNSQHVAIQPAVQAAPQPAVQEHKEQLSVDMLDRMKLLESEILKFKQEQAKLKQIQHEEQIELHYIRSECEQAKQRLAAERQQFEQYKAAENKKLKQASVELLSKQRKLQQQPERNERKQIDTLKSEIADLQLQLRTLDEKHKAKIATLKKSTEQLQAENTLLKQELADMQKLKYTSVAAAQSNVQPPKTAPHLHTTPTKHRSTSNKRSQHAPASSSKHAWSTPDKQADRPTTSSSTHAHNTTHSAADTHISSTPQRTPFKATMDSANRVVQEIEHAGGKREKVYTDGLRIIEFPNGTSKHILPNGEILVEFVNGDTKRIYSNGNILYYYSSVNTTHLTEKAGMQYYRFDNGQIEKHGSNNEKWIYYTDMTVKHILPDGTEEVRQIRSPSEIPQF